MQKFRSHLESLSGFPVVYGNINEAFSKDEGQLTASDQMVRLTNLEE